MGMGVGVGVGVDGDGKGDGNGNGRDLERGGLGVSATASASASSDCTLDGNAPRTSITSPSTPHTPHHHHHHDENPAPNYAPPPSPPPPALPLWHAAGEKLPAPLVRLVNKTTRWMRGPEPPRRHRLVPFKARVQTAPRDFLHGLWWGWRWVLFGLACLGWCVGFGVLVGEDEDAAGVGGLGVVRLGCVDSLWSSAEYCGLDGRNCLPFDNASFAFSCPANCASAMVLNPRTVGNQSYNYRSLVIGGPFSPDPNDASASVSSTSWRYRGDSFICGAAIHWGSDISDKKGGCGVLTLKGAQIGFASSLRNGIRSIPFYGEFPMSFEFSGMSGGGCEDPRWKLLALSVTMTVLFGVFTTRPATFFAPLFTILFFQVGMASDPPAYTTRADLASTALGRFLPAALIAVVMYRISIARALKGCTAHLEKTILWVGGAWVGALSNYTFDQIPIQRLTGHDLRQQPGAIAALVIIVLILFLVAIYQAWCFRLEGRLPHYLAIYACLGVSLAILAALPHLHLRIHHYILALLLLPGTAMQTRISLLCQGLLVGLFINGVARWGFAPILETAAALRADAQLGSALPTIMPPVLDPASISFTWDTPAAGWDGVSVLVNDVQRYLGNSGFTWYRNSSTVDGPTAALLRAQPGVEVGTAFRFGFFRYLPFGNMAFGDYTRAGVWFANGSWSEIPLGRT